MAHCLPSEPYSGGLYRKLDRSVYTGPLSVSFTVRSPSRTGSSLDASDGRSPSFGGDASAFEILRRGFALRIRFAGFAFVRPLDLARAFTLARGFAFGLDFALDRDFTLVLIFTIHPPFGRLMPVLSAPSSTAWIFLSTAIIAAIRRK
jgi:hypothetical protein